MQRLSRETIPTFSDQMLWLGEKYQAPRFLTPSIVIGLPIGFLGSAAIIFSLIDHKIVNPLNERFLPVLGAY